MSQDQREEEIVDICSKANQPGFGYAVLATLMTSHKEFGYVITTNFDNLIAEAFYIYTNTKPLVVPYETLAHRVQPFRKVPKIIKIQGDAHVDLYNTKHTQSELAQETRQALATLLDGQGLVFIGYSGNDHSVVDALSLVRGPRNVYWINDYKPGASLQVWLKKRGYIQVTPADFDELMLLIQDKFKLSHPSKTRLDQFLREYANKLLDVASSFTTAPAKERREIFSRRMEAVQTEGYAKEFEIEMTQRFLRLMAQHRDSELAAQFEDTLDWSLIHERVRHGLENHIFVDDPAIPDKSQANQIYESALEKLPESIELILSFAHYLTETFQLDLAHEQCLKARKLAPKDPFVLNQLTQIEQILREERYAPSGETSTSSTSRVDKAMNQKPVRWVVDSSSDVVLSMHPSTKGTWRDALPYGNEVHLRELHIVTPPQNWHITEPPTSPHWKTVEQHMEAQLQELDRIPCKRIHVFANTPYSLAALLGNRLVQRFGRGRELVFYQFNVVTKTWEDWGPNRQLVAPTRGEPFLRMEMGGAASGAAKHVVVAIHLSRQASREEIDRALSQLGAGASVAWVDVLPPGAPGQAVLDEPAAVDRCVDDLDAILFKVATDHPAARMHVFYVGPKAVLMRAAAKLQLLSIPAVLYERIQGGGGYMFVPALELRDQKLLIGGPPTASLPSSPAAAVASTTEWPARLRVLAVASEWASSKGGLSTFNRLLCRALVQRGHDVTCLVPEANDKERVNARDAGVRLVEMTETGIPEVARPFLKPADAGLAPQVVIGHGRVTGDAARVQARSHFPGSRLVHFVHTEPDYIEWFKGDVISEDASRKADERKAYELRMASQADLVVGVGPKLAGWAHDSLVVGVQKKIPILRLDPGLTDINPVNARPNAVRCLLLGRAEDRRLKGIDIALRALEKQQGRPPELMIRGVAPGEATEFSDWIKSLAPRLNVRPFGYSSSEETIAADIRQASVVLMPSRSEGFGLVGLEAISAAVPVLVSDRSGLGEVLLEVGTDAARRAVVETSGADDEADVAAWSTKIGHVLHNRDAAYADARQLREELAPVLDWNKAVDTLVDKLREVSRARGLHQPRPEEGALP